MRVAIVHDNLIQFGGAERVLLALMELFPHAPVYTLLYDPAVAPTMRAANPAFDERRIRPSFLQRFPWARRHHHYLPLLMPLAAEQFDLRGYDIVLSDTYSYAKGVITDAGTMHISYCFTPTRYVWDDCHRYVRAFAERALFLRLAPLGLSYIRLWDYFASQRVDHYITLSAFVAERIKKYYGKPAQVIAPPVDVDRFSVSTTHDDYYIVVSRLVPYKRVDLAVAACVKLGQRLKVVGTGPEIARLKKQAGPTIEFLGFVPDEELPALYAGARALLFPQEEDFGITVLEAAANGKPTIAYASGGALETIVNSETGVFFAEQTVDSLVAAMVDFEKKEFDPERIRAHAQLYSHQRFLRELGEVVHTQWMQYQQAYRTRV
jgi:glycosyltransferase involved in cell wall biosynthesis